MWFELSVDVEATPERVWSVLLDVGRWHEWTPSVREIRCLSAGPLAQGSEVRIRQPRLRPAVYRVTELVPGRALVWTTQSIGLRAEASHRIEPRGAGSRVTLAVRLSGALAWLLRPWLASLTRRYVTMEATGLKARCERVEP